eukprot:1149420-Pelagomonas_calceolata.AAC.1
MAKDISQRKGSSAEADDLYQFVKKVDALWLDVGCGNQQTGAVPWFLPECWALEKGRHPKEAIRSWSKGDDMVDQTHWRRIIEHNTAVGPKAIPGSIRFFKFPCWHAGRFASAGCFCSLSVHAACPCQCLLSVSSHLCQPQQIAGTCAGSLKWDAPWLRLPNLSPPQTHPQVRSGQEVENAEIVRFARLFNDELTLDNLQRCTLLSICIDCKWGHSTRCCEGLQRSLSMPPYVININYRFTFSRVR